MSNRVLTNDKVRAYLKLLGNPYASLSLEEESVASPVIQTTFEERRLRYNLMQNPYAYCEFFDDVEKAVGDGKTAEMTQLELLNQAGNGTQADSPNVERELDEVLDLYRPYIARNEWNRIAAFRKEFLLGTTTLNSSRVVAKLKGLKFSLMPGERVEFNRAPAVRIIGELTKFLE